jgi:hypothetical protein
VRDRNSTRPFPTFIPLEPDNEPPGEPPDESPETLPDIPPDDPPDDPPEPGEGRRVSRDQVRYIGLHQSRRRLSHC